MKLRGLAGASIGLLIFAFVAVAPTTSTEILGTDSSGAVIAGARVTLLRVATSERRETVTDSTGNYSFPLIDTGDTPLRSKRRDSRRRNGTALLSNCSRRLPSTSS